MVDAVCSGISVISGFDLYFRTKSKPEEITNEQIDIEQRRLLRSKHL